MQGLNRAQRAMAEHWRMNEGAPPANSLPPIMAAVYDNPKYERVFNLELPAGILIASAPTVATTKGLIISAETHCSRLAGRPAVNVTDLVVLGLSPIRSAYPDTEVYGDNTSVTWIPHWEPNRLFALVITARDAYPVSGGTCKAIREAVAQDERFSTVPYCIWQIGVATDKIGNMPNYFFEGDLHETWISDRTVYDTALEYTLAETNPEVVSEHSRFVPGRMALYSFTVMIAHLGTFNTGGTIVSGRADDLATVHRPVPGSGSTRGHFPITSRPGKAGTHPLMPTDRRPRSPDPILRPGRRIIRTSSHRSPPPTKEAQPRFFSNAEGNVLGGGTPPADDATTTEPVAEKPPARATSRSKTSKKRKRRIKTTRGQDGGGGDEEGVRRAMEVDALAKQQEELDAMIHASATDQ